MKHYSESEKQAEAELIAINLKHVGRLNRRGLLAFLELKGSKTNTERLRGKARLRAIYRPGLEVADILDTIEQNGGAS